ncbi:hypothetical protein LPJ59_001213 [Coemansia sp. RSA 2399]|nr:hypothetical protein LPJ59_001213 [Coemansia sp. RSA 2399]KAJ1906967.1 hypothetical protein LPJ81_001043 [Coemansia sp. IMI 209127]
MATIPSLIVGPALVAAGLAYRYSRFDDDDQQKEGGAGFSGIHARRMSEMTSSTTGYDHTGGFSMGARFEGDFQPPVPSERQRTDAFVPTNMVVASSSSSFSTGGGGGSLTQYQGQSKATAGEPQSGHLEQQTGRRQSISDQIADRRVAGELAKHDNPYPRTTDELENRSWLFRTIHRVTGDLGPIEHKDTSIEQQRLVFPADSNREQISSTQGANALKGTRVFSSEQPEVGSSRSRNGTQTSPGDVVDSATRQASRLADDVTGAGGSSSGSSSLSSKNSNGGWFWGSSSDKSTADVAKKAADESRGWFWNRKQDAGQAASDAVGSAKDTLQSASDSAQQGADDTRGWFQSRKQDVDQAASDAVGSAKDTLQSASDSAQQAADNTRGWFWNKKQNVDSAVDDTVGSVESKLQSASDSVNQAADSAKGSLQSASDSVKGSLQSASDSAKESAGSTRDWFWNKKHDAGNAVSDTVDSAKNSMNDAAAGTHDWLKDRKDNAQGAVEHEWEWVTGKVDDMGRSTRDAAQSVGDSVGRATDASQSWMWSQKSQADNAVANAAGNVHDYAASASDRAAQRSAEHREAAGHMGDYSASNGAMDNALSGGEPPERSSTRRDSMMAPLKSNSVLDTLDSKFDEARTALRHTSEELRTMANDAGSAASEKIRDAAETVRFHPTNEGIVRGGGETKSSEDIAMRFVELDSGIPQLSNAHGSQATTAAPARRNR